MQKKVLRSAIVAFFAAIICATGFFRVPVPGIQQGILIQNAMCVLTAVLLGGVAGVLPTALFVAVGVLGLPVFAGGQGGFQVLTHIHGGYRIGWVLAALVAGVISLRPSVAEKHVTKGMVVRLSLAVVVALLVVYVPELLYVVAFEKASLGVGGAVRLFFAAFFAPFVLVDLLKAAVAVVLALKIRPVVAQYLYE